MHELKVARSQALTTREMAQIGLFTALIAAGAYIKINIPVQPFPMHFTMQFLFVLLAGFLLGARRGAICVGIYLAVGLSGIPVFAAGGGPAYLIRPTFGFLLGFVFAAWITGKLSSFARSRYCLGSVQCLLGDDGLLCFRNGVFLWDQ